SAEIRVYPEFTTPMGGFFINIYIRIFKLLKGDDMGFRTVFVKNGNKLSLKLDNLEVRKLDQKYVIPLIDIDTVILEGDQTIVTTRILSAFTKYHIVVVICDQKYLPVGMYLGMGQYHRSAKRAMWQAKWTELQKDLV